MSRNLFKKRIQEKLEERQSMFNYHKEQMVIYQYQVCLLKELLEKGGNDNGSGNSSNG